MSNKFLDQKRSSLDLSDSESEGDNYRKGGYSKNQKEDYSSPDDLRSPDTNSLGDSLRPTPKSILKENLGSGSKAGKKNILINETLNETHRIPQKSESNMSSPDRQFSSAERDDKYRDYIREEQSKSATPGYSSRSEDTQSPSKGATDDDEEYESKMSAKYSKDNYGGENTSFKNRLVVGSIGGSDNATSDFQRAHVRKLQQEREQEISSRAVKESAEKVRERWQLEKERRDLDAYEHRSNQETGYSYSKGLGERQVNRDHDIDYGYSGRKADSLLSRGIDPSAKFERIENKISHLESDLQNYSKSLTKSAVIQEEKNKDLNKVYEEFEDRMKDLKDEINQSINEHRKSDRKFADSLHSRGYSEERSRANKATTKYKSGVSSLTKSSKHGKSADRLKSGKVKGTSTAFRKLQEEIEKLKYENEELREKLSEKEMKEKARTIKAKALAGPDLDREKELLETIERIKKKLRRSITKKVQEEKNKQMEATREEAAAKSFGRNYTSYGFHYKDILKRKELEDRTLSKENMMLLHKGLPTTYKNYEGPIFAEKLSKTKTKI